MKKNQAAYERFFNHSLDLMVISDYSGKIKLVNPAWENILGYTKIELEGKKQSEFLHPDDVDLTQAFIRNKIKFGRTGINLQNRYRCRDYSYRWIFWNLVIFQEEAIIYGYGRDITEDKQTEELLTKRERYLSTLVELQHQLLACDHLNDYYPNFLQQLGETTTASRAYLFNCFLEKTGKMLASQRFEWCTEGISSEIDNSLLQNFPLEETLPDLYNTLKQGKIFCKTLAECNESEREVLEFQDILSILLLPLIVEGELVGFFGFDICTEVRRWEELEITMLQVAATVVSLKLEHLKVQQQIQASLQEKEVLLKEIHHRVKNNLQVISSLLDLQGCQSSDAVTTRMFSESRNRVRAMALIHEKLYQSDNLSKVNVAEYVDALIVDLIYNYAMYPRQINIQIKIDNIYLNIDTAIPIGLIVNELVSNALKHGFPEKKSGTIWIELISEDEDTEFLLVVKNDGVKLPDNLNLQTANSLGLQVVNALSNQLDGQVKAVAEPVTTFEVRFAQVNH